MKPPIENATSARQPAEAFLNAAAGLQPGILMSDKESGTSKDTALGRRAREQVQRRKEILDAARRLFARKGYAGTTLEEVARMAEFAKPTLYQFFAGKENLFYAILQEGGTDLLGILEKIKGQTASSSQQFRTMSIMFLIYFRKNLDFFLIWRQFSERLKRDSDVEQHEAVQQLFAMVESNMAWVLKQGMETAEFRPMDTKRVASILLESLSVYTHAFREGGEVRTANEMADEIMDLYLKGLLIR